MKIRGSKVIDFFYFKKDQVLSDLALFFAPLYIRIYSVVLFFLNLLNWVFVYYINKIVSQDLVILHYNINFGANLLGSASQIYTIPFLGLVFILLNSVLAINIRQPDKFINHLLFFALILVNIFLLTATMSVYLVNFR